jgi:hypothetical protein
VPVWVINPPTRPAAAMAVPAVAAAPDAAAAAVSSGLAAAGGSGTSTFPESICSPSVSLPLFHASVAASSGMSSGALQSSHSFNFGHSSPETNNFSACSTLSVFIIRSTIVSRACTWSLLL